MKRPSRRDNARHEAAHALVAWLSGIPLEVCAIRTQPVTADQKRFVSLGYTRITDEEDGRINSLLLSQQEASEEERRYLSRHLLFAVAGFVAEQTAGTTSQESTGSDRRNAMLLAGRLGGGRIVGDRYTGKMDIPDERKPQFFQILSEAEDQVKKLLTDHAAAWDGLSSRLLFDSSLTGEQIDQFLTGVLGKREV
jgi:ATP-dependent Zn protease